MVTYGHTPDQPRESRNRTCRGLTTLFWFPAGVAAVTCRPIALFELGQALGEGRRIVVGADPGFSRKPDVRMLCQLARPGLPVYADLTDTLRVVLRACGQECS